MHRRIMDVFRQYEVVGGMPQVVARFVATHDLKAVDVEKRDILDLYRGDIMKFGGASKHRILAVFNAIPGLLARHERKFSPGMVKRASGMREYAATFEWLKSAMTVNVAYGVTEPNIGLELSSDHSALKCYLGDTGLLVSMAFAESEAVSADAQQRLLTGRLEVNRGMIAENLVAQMLRAADVGLYFYSNTDRENGSNTMEIDFLLAKSMLERRHNICPVEVKSAGAYATKSLDKFLTKFASFTGRSFVLHPKDLREEGNRLFLPLYMAGLLAGVKTELP